MKRNLFIVFICFCFFGKVEGQHRYLDNNPIWVLTGSCYAGSCLWDNGNIYYYLKGDTVMGGYSYHKVFKKELHYVFCPVGTSYSYGSSDTINPCYYLRDTLKQIRCWVGNDQLLYDFDRHIGDTLLQDNLVVDTCGFILTSIDSIPVSNYFRKKFTYTSQTNPSTRYLYEGIGWDIGFLEQMFFCPNVSSLCGYDLTCYGVNDTAWFPNYNAISPCTVPNFTIGIKEIPKLINNIILSPNPTTALTTITFSTMQQNTTINITDVLGKLIYTTTATQTKQVNIQLNAAPGMYFVTILTNENRQVVKLIRQ